MNRSIFQIWQMKLVEIIFSFVLSFFVLFFIIYFSDDKCECVSFRGVQNSFLKEMRYKNTIFMYSKSLEESNVKSAIDIAFNNDIINQFSICKYFEICNEKPKLFEKNSCYAHPNLFFGLHNNLYFNLQFSHKKLNNYFNPFTDNDIENKFKLQYLCDQIYIYDDNLDQQFLNFNDLIKNNFTPYTNNNPISTQNYLYTNNNSLTKNILNGFKS